MVSKNVTISLDEDLLKAGRRYAKNQGTSLNKLFREFIEDKVVGKSGAQGADDFLDALDNASGTSGGRGWSRADAYSK